MMAPDRWALVPHAGTSPQHAVVVFFLQNNNNDTLNIEENINEVYRLIIIMSII